MINDHLIEVARAIFEHGDMIEREAGAGDEKAHLILHLWKTISYSVDTQAVVLCSQYIAQRRQLRQAINKHLWFIGSRYEYMESRRYLADTQQRYGGNWRFDFTFNWVENHTSLRMADPEKAEFLYGDGGYHAYEAHIARAIQQQVNEITLRKLGYRPPMTTTTW